METKNYQYVNFITNNIIILMAMNIKCTQQVIFMQYIK